jgi:hypothetical protein
VKGCAVGKQSEDEDKGEKNAVGAIRQVHRGMGKQSEEEEAEEGGSDAWGMHYG